MERVVQIFSVKDNQVYLIEEFEVFPEVVAFRKAFKDDERSLKNILEYLHFVYSKKSPYFYLEFENRKRIVCNDRFKNETIHSKIEQRIEVKNFIKKLNILQFTENETFYNGIRLKISEYLRLWQDNPITKDNADEVALQLKIKPLELLEMKKKVEDMIFEEQRLASMAKQTGKKLFEEPETDNKF